jgi:hypothetical protein
MTDTTKSRRFGRLRKSAKWPCLRWLTRLQSSTLTNHRLESGMEVENIDMALLEGIVSVPGGRNKKCMANGIRPMTTAI